MAKSTFSCNLPHLNEAPNCERLRSTNIEIENIWELQSVVVQDSLAVSGCFPSLDGYRMSSL